MRKNKFLIFYLSLLLILNSCGFQLRKPLDLDYQSYAITGDSQGLSKLIHKQLSFANIKENKDGNADLIIEIMSNNFQKRILSLAGRGQVGEFELIQTVEYRVKIDGQWSEPRRLEAIREYTYDPSLYNAARAEEVLLKDSMIEQLSRSLLTEINNLGKK
jgi:LPS-assembly lipoprotein